MVLLQDVGKSTKKIIIDKECSADNRKHGGQVRNKVSQQEASDDIPIQNFPSCLFSLLTAYTLA